MKKNNYIPGIIMRPCSTTDEGNESTMTSSEYSTGKDFMDNYRNHKAAMQIVAECAKVYINKNWQKVSDWSNLNVIMCQAKNIVEYYNYIPRKGGREHDEFMDLFKGIDLSNKKKHNPIKTVSEVILDPSDGDFFITMNGNVHWVMDDEAVIIADYIERQLKTNQLA